jgi:hypothetical protein
MRTFTRFLENKTFAGLESAMDVYYRCGGDGKKSITHPDMPGYWLHPNGIVSPDRPEGDEHVPIFDSAELASLYSR